MDKKVLLAVDDSIHSKQAVKYVIGMSSYIKDLSYIFFHVQPCLSQFIVDEAATDIKARAALEKLKKRNQENALSIMENLKKFMIESGVPEKNIELETHPKRAGLAKDIMEFAQEKRYDAIVVGRRGLSRVQEVFMGSLTSNLLEHSKVIPVWVVDGEVSSEKVMIAVDGSESALRAVDHFSFMVSHNPNIKVTLFHVSPSSEDCISGFEDTETNIEEIIVKGHRKRVQSFLIDAFKKFKDAGIQENQIFVKEVQNQSKPGKAIVEEAEKGNYGTVVVGRRGINKAFFMGSVSKYVLERTANRALWLIS